MPTHEGGLQVGMQVGFLEAVARAEWNRLRREAGLLPGLLLWRQRLPGWVLCRHLEAAYGLTRPRELPGVWLLRLES